MVSPIIHQILHLLKGAWIKFDIYGQRIYGILIIFKGRQQITPCTWPGFRYLSYILCMPFTQKPFFHKWSSDVCWRWTYIAHFSLLDKGRIFIIPKPILLIWPDGCYEVRGLNTKENGSCNVDLLLVIGFSIEAAETEELSWKATQTLKEGRTNYMYYKCDSNY